MSMHPSTSIPVRYTNYTGHLGLSRDLPAGSQTLDFLMLREAQMSLDCRPSLHPRPCYKEPPGPPPNYHKTHIAAATITVNDHQITASIKPYPSTPRNRFSAQLPWQ